VARANSTKEPIYDLRTQIFSSKLFFLRQSDLPRWNSKIIITNETGHYAHIIRHNSLQLSELFKLINEENASSAKSVALDSTPGLYIFGYIL